MKVTIAADFQKLFRALTETELEHAKASNLADPDHERIPPIVIWKCGNDWLVVDGHHTNAIRQNLRVDGKPVKIRYHEMEFSDRAEALVYAIRAQVGRRNLNASQIAMALAQLPKAKPGPKPKGELPANWRELPNRETLAAESGVGEKTMERADKVKDQGAQAVIDAVVAGDVKVSDASAVADLPKSEQVKALKKVKAGKAKTLKTASAKRPPVTKADPKALWKEWDHAIGPLVRVVERIATQVNQRNGEHHKTVREHLDVASEEMAEWLGVKK